MREAYTSSRWALVCRLMKNSLLPLSGTSKCAIAAVPRVFDIRTPCLVSLTGKSPNGFFRFSPCTAALDHKVASVEGGVVEEACCASLM